MAQFVITEVSRGDESTGEASGCSLCGAVEGPFVACDNASFKVNTVNGPVLADKPLQLCAPRMDGDVVLRQGCVGTMALLIGYVSPVVLNDMRSDVYRADAVVAELQAEVKALKKSQVNVVPVAELMTLIEAAKA